MLTERGKLVASGKLKPKTESDQTFKIAIACELVFAWEDATPAVRDSLERVMMNVGIDRTEDGYWSLGHYSFRKIKVWQ